MNPILIHFEEEKFKSEISALENVADMLNGIINKYNAIGKGSLETASQLKELLSNPKDVLFQAIMKDQPMELNGMKLSKEKLFDICVKPVEYHEVLNLVDKANTRVEFIRTSQYYPALNWMSNAQMISSFDFENGAIKGIQQDKIEGVRKHYEVYADTETSQRNYKLAKSICDLLNASDLFAPTNDQYRNKRAVELLLECIKVNSTEKGGASLDITRVRYNQ